MRRIRQRQESGLCVTTSHRFILEPSLYQFTETNTSRHEDVTVSCLKRSQYSPSVTEGTNEFYDFSCPPG